MKKFFTCFFSFFFIVGVATAQTDFDKSFKNKKDKELFNKYIQAGEFKKALKLAKPDSSAYETALNSLEAAAKGSKKKETFTVSLQVGLVYKDGIPVPVCRQTFALFDNGTKPPSVESAQEYIDNCSIDADLASAQLDFTLGYSELCRSGIGSNLKEALNTFLKNVNRRKKTAETQTDFSGKGDFKDIPPGKYKLLGISPTRKAFAVWWQDVKVEKNVDVILDQKNALFVE